MSVQFKDYYKTLGVPKTATEDEIRKAFRALARKHHPDMVKAKEKPAAEAKFKEVNEAYEVLSDPEKRQKYDTLGADWERGPRPGPQWGGFQQGAPGRGRGGKGGAEFEFDGTGFSDFFEQFFGGMGQGRRGGGGFGDIFGGGSQSEPQRGEDVEADMMVTLEEAVKGSQRQITLRRPDSSQTETYNVRIPAGVREGQRIRLAGRGRPGPRGGTPGDLYLNVRLSRHPDFHVEDGDLVHEVTIPAWDAVLGKEITVPTIGGKVTMKIPAGTQSGQRFRLKGQGVHTASGVRGNLYVKVSVSLPKKLSNEERELWEKLAGVSR